MFDISVSLHVFNRPDCTRKVFEVIRLIRPKKLFITADGPRIDNKNDYIKCQESRDILDTIDWECDVYKNFHDSNQGSYKATSEGISWVFTHVDRAIILEDDCIPNHDFFLFCKELLNKFDENKEIAMISGAKVCPKEPVNKDSYIFSKYMYTWGWATWKDRWESVEFDMKNWPAERESHFLKVLFKNKSERWFWQGIFDRMFWKRDTKHWDYLFALSSFKKSQLCIVPNKNLITNIGFGLDATHFKKKTIQQGLFAENILFPLIHPDRISIDRNSDDWAAKNIYGRGWVGWIKIKIKDILYYLNIRT